MNKKVFLLVTFLFCSCLIFAQQQQAPDYVYCELRESPRLFSTKINIELDYGQDRVFFNDNRMQDEETGRIKKFNSMVDALNYMSSHGWELAQAMFSPSASNSSNAQSGVRIYLLKRKLNDQEKTEWLNNAKKK
jgi:hypothetical protein